MPRFGQVITAMVTPFHKDGSLNLDGAKRLARWLQDNGNDGLVIAGTTGEAPVLTDDERLSLFKAVVEAVTIPVIAGPIDSIRWEMNREGIEDREYCWLLKQLIARTSGELGSNSAPVLAALAAQSNALSMVTWPQTRMSEAEGMVAARETIAQAIESLGSLRPIIAEQPVSKTVLAGTSEYLQAEVIGYPEPAIQWLLNGTNLPGATSSRLYLTNISFGMAGGYQLVASNGAGTTVSALADLNVYTGSSQPVIIRQPVSVQSTNSGRAVLGVLASSVSPMTYQWYFNGTVIQGATNMTLVLTNLTVDKVGHYSVLVGNAAGPTISTAASVGIPLAPLLQARLGLQGIRITISSLVATGQVQFSTNFFNWQTLTNLPPSAGPAIYLDKNTNSPGRFYRVVIPR